MNATPQSPQARRLRSPLLIALWALLAIESLGGLVIFVVALVGGGRPGETLHVWAGLAMVPVYAWYQVAHWRRVRPWRGRVHDTLGLIAAASMVVTLASGLALAWPWWQARGTGEPPAYPALVTALHLSFTMLVLTFIGAHLGAVLRRGRGPSRNGEE